MKNTAPHYVVYLLLLVHLALPLGGCRTPYSGGDHAESPPKNDPTVVPPSHEHLGLADAVNDGEAGSNANDSKRSVFAVLYERALEALTPQAAGSDSGDAEEVDPKILQLKNEAHIAAVRKLLDERAARLGPAFGRLNILVVKIEFGGGHKAAKDAVVSSLTAKIGEKYINIHEFDFFGDRDASLVAERFNAHLQNEVGWKIAKNIGQRVRREAWLDTPEGGEWMSQNMKAAIHKLGGPPPDVVISVQPFGIRAMHQYFRNNYAADFRVLPTDYYMGDWIDHIGKDQDRLFFDASNNIPYMRKQFERYKIQNVNWVEYPVREEITSFADRLYSPLEAVRQEAAAEARESIQNMVELFDSTARAIGSPPVLDGDQLDSSSETVAARGGQYGKEDKSVLIMMGSRGVTAKRYLNYLTEIARNPPKINKPKGKIHVFIAALRDSNDVSTTGRLVRDEVADGIAKIEKSFPHGKVIFHICPKLGAAAVAHLMSEGVILTKAGGSTAAEIAKMRGRALFNMRVTAYAPWESGNADLLVEQNMAIKMPAKSDEAEAKALTKNIEDAFALKPKGLPSVGESFHERYQKVFFERMHQKLEAEIPVASAPASPPTPAREEAN